MRAPSILAVVVLLGILAGCAGGGPGGAAPRAASPVERAGASPEPPGPGQGTVVGIVTDDEARPLEGALVHLEAGARTAPSASDGAFAFGQVPAGSWRLDVEAAGHRPFTTQVTVTPGLTAHVAAVLERLASNASHHVTSIFEGHYTCAHELLIWTGDCGILYESQAGQEDPFWSEKFMFRLPVHEGWSTVVVELEWTYASNNQFDGMRLYLENGNGSGENGHAFKVARVDGPENPLRLRVDRGEPHPRADFYPGTGVKAQIPDRGEEAQVRVFPRGKLYEYTSLVCLNPFQNQSCLLGVGLGLDIRFTVYATVFYGSRAPEGFTATPGAS